MLRATLSISIGVLLAIAAAAAQESRATPEGVAGVWVILLEGHQVGLGLEQDGPKVTGTLQIRGRNIPVDGEFADRTLTLAGEAQVGRQGDTESAPLKLTATLKADGTLEGEMNTAHGPMKWTAERLKPPKS